MRREKDPPLLLVVDDVPMLLKSIARKLGRNRTVVCASSLEEALPHLEGGQVTLAIIDAWLKHRSGGELALIIRERWPDVGMIMMSGLWQPDIMRACFLAGAFDCVEKDTRLVETVETLIGRWESGQRPPLVHGPFEPPTLETMRDTFSVGLLRMMNGNVTQAAEVANVPRTTMQRRLKQARDRVAQAKRDRKNC